MSGQYIIPAAKGAGLTAKGNEAGGLDVFDARGSYALTLLPSYINECGGALEALDTFYAPSEWESVRYFGPARVAA